jgi:molecular chaperone GrpE
MEATSQDKNRASGDESAEVTRLKEELRREHDMYLRALADFDNYRRRVERERSTADRSGKREVLRSLLDVLDNFDRAFSHIGDAPSSVSQGVQLLQRQILALLEAQGVLPLKSLGETFNPELHEAIGTVKSEEVESGAVAEEVQRGYRWGDEVLRPARVRVASGP